MRKYWYHVPFVGPTALNLHLYVVRFFLEGWGNQGFLGHRCRHLAQPIAWWPASVAYLRSTLPNFANLPCATCTHHFLFPLTPVTSC